MNLFDKRRKLNFLCLGRIEGYNWHEGHRMVCVRWGQHPNLTEYSDNVPLYFFRKQRLKVPLVVGQMFKFKKCLRRGRVFEKVIEVLGVDEQYAAQQRAENERLAEELQRVIATL